MPTTAASALAPVLVAGGTGFIGGIIARSLVTAGRTVIVPSRSGQRLDQLAADCRAELGTLVPLHVPSDHPHLAAADLLRADAGVQPGAVVAALGGWAKAGALIDLTPQQWDEALRDHLTSHLEAIQAYVPLLTGADDPSYITLNGAAASQAMAGSGAISVTGAAQHMLTAVMRAEPVGSSVRFHELSVMAAVAGDARNVDPAFEVTPAQVSRAVEQLLGDSSAEAFVSIDADGR